jgi:hypothetical protein
MLLDSTTSNGQSEKQRTRRKMVAREVHVPRQELNKKWRAGAESFHR